MPTNDVQDLRLRARHAIRKHLLPSRRPDQTYGGPGNGAACAVCGNAMAAADMVFHLEFAAEDTEATNYQLHVRCFTAWEFARADSEEQHDLRFGAVRATLSGSDRDQTSSGQRE